MHRACAVAGGLGACELSPRLAAADSARVGEAGLVRRELAGTAEAPSAGRMMSNITSDAFPCSAYPVAAARGACERMTSPGKRARHMARMANCNFRPELMKVLIVGSAETQIDLNAWRFLDGGRVNHADGAVSLRYCSVPDPVRDAGWHFFRIGPFVTTGGNTWTQQL